MFCVKLQQCDEMAVTRAQHRFNDNLLLDLDLGPLACHIKLTLECHISLELQSQLPPGEFFVAFIRSAIWESSALQGSVRMRVKGNDRSAASMSLMKLYNTLVLYFGVLNWRYKFKRFEMALHCLAF